MKFEWKFNGALLIRQYACAKDDVIHKQNPSLLARTLYFWRETATAVQVCLCGDYLLEPASTMSGLTNVGNTCFVNAIIQTVVHVPPLMEFLEQNSSLERHGK